MHFSIYKSTDSFHGDGSFEESDRQYFQSDLNSEILELSTGIEEEVIGAMRDKEVEEQLKAVEKIAADVLDARELFLWKSFVSSPATPKEAGEQCTPPISASRVHQLISTARKKILEEMGRRSLRATLSA